MDVDKFYRMLGRPGRYHVLIYIFLCCNYLPVIMNHLAMAIYGARTGHHCLVPSGHQLNESIPYRWTHTGMVPDQCHMYVNWSYSNNDTLPCTHGWHYDLGPRETNIISEWELVCDQKYMSSLATSLYFSGVMFGGVIFGTLSDMWGRKPSMLFTLYAHIVVGVGISFSNSYLVFVLLRLLQGVLMQGLQTCSFVLILELFAHEDRTVVGTVFEIFWGTGVLWLAFISWLIQDWRTIQLAITLPSLITVFYICALPESVRWLIAKKRFKEADVILKKAAKFNGVTIPEDPLDIENTKLTRISDEKIDQKGQKTYTLIDMFRTRELCKRSLILFYAWFVTATGYYGLSLSITSLAGNKYLNLFVGGLLELPAYCSAVYIVKRFGRRRPLCVYLFIGGVFCISAGLVPNKILHGIDLSHAATGLAVVGRFGMAGCFSVILLYTCELFPTVIRNVSMGSCAFWSRVGGMVAPQLLFLNQYTFPAFSVVVIGSLSLLGGLLVLTLPETKDQCLVDTIEEAVHMGRQENNHSNGEDTDRIQDQQMKIEQQRPLKEEETCI